MDVNVNTDNHEFMWSGLCWLMETFTLIINLLKASVKSCVVKVIAGEKMKDTADEIHPSTILFKSIS